MTEARHTLRGNTPWARLWLSALLNGNRHRQFEAVALTLMVCCLGFALVGTHPAYIQVNLLTAAAALLSLVVHHFKPNWRVGLAWLLWAVSETASTITVIWQGGLWSNAMGYLFICNVGFLMLINLRAVSIALIATTLQVAGLAWLEANHHIGPSAIEPDNVLWSLTAFICLLMPFILLNMVVHQTQKRLALKLQHDNRVLAETQEALRRQHAVQDQFVASVSHELRTPMHAIMGFLQTIDRSDNIAGHDLEMLDLMAHSARQLLLRINELLDFSRLQAGKLHIREQAIDLRAELRALQHPLAIDEGTHSARVNIEVAASVPPWITADGERLMQALYNLVGNAMKFAPHGDIWIRVTTQPGDTIELTVIDQGPGIAASEQIHLFNRLSPLTSRTRREMGGTGLGLSITKALVELMGGHLRVESQLGRGSAFTISLPLRVACAPRPFIDQTNPGQKSETQGVVLIVDDSSVNRLVAQKLLQSALPRLSLLLAASGEEALALMRERTVDLILMDIVMPPGMNGLQTTQLLRQMLRARAPGVIGVTADTNEKATEACLTAGMQSVLHKPFTAGALSDAVFLALQARRHATASPNVLA